MGNRAILGGARCVLVSAVALFLAPAMASADKKADEEWKKINPPAPYTLFVETAANKNGAERILKIFDAKNAQKKWRPHYDTWFRLVPSREQAEIVIDVGDSGREQKPGYEALYYITGRLTIAGIVRDTPIRGDDTIRLFGDTQEQFDLLNRIVRFMRDHYKEAVLVHSARGATVSPQPKPDEGPPSATTTGGPAAEEEDDPLYVHWARFKPGSWVLRRSEGTLSGDTKETLKSVGPAEVVIEVVGTSTRTETIRAKRKVEPKKGTPWQESEEVAEIAGKSLQCHAQKTAEMSRWYCPEVPGGFAKFEWKKDGKFVQRVWAIAWEGKQ